MTQLAAATIFVLSLLLIGALVWARLLAKERNEYQALYQKVCDQKPLERLGEEAGLHRYEMERHLDHHQMRRSRLPEEDFMREQVETMLKGLLQELVQQGAVRIERSDIPAQPGVRFRVFTWACGGLRYREKEEGELVDDLLDRVERRGVTAR